MRPVLRSIVKLERAIRRLKGSADFYFHSYPFISEENRSWSGWTHALLKIHDSNVIPIRISNMLRDREWNSRKEEIAPWVL